MSKVIFKYPIELGMETRIWLPEGSEILTVQAQHDSICLWALVDTSKYNTEERIFAVYPTGFYFYNDPGKYLGTVQFSNGHVVLHVFELKPDPLTNPYR